MATEEKGLSYVSQIKEAYDAMIKADGNVLDAKLKLGQLLKGAKDAVGHGNFNHYLGLHCSYISHRSANDYMKLAEHREKLADIRSALRISSEGDLSIRAALRAIRTPEEVQAAAERAAKAKASKEAKKEQRFDDLPEDDESGTSLKDWLDNTAPDLLFIELKGSWDNDALEELGKLISDHIARTPRRLPHVEPLRTNVMPQQPTA